MLQFDRINDPIGIDVKETSESKECDFCHYCYFLDKGFKFELDVWNGCHDVLIMSMNLNDIAVINIRAADYHYTIGRIGKSEVIT